MTNRLAVWIMALSLTVMGGTRAFAAPDVAGWVWLDENSPYGYVFSEGGWIYIDGTEKPGWWFYNFNTHHWSANGPSGVWFWFQYPYFYSLENATWYYLVVPPGGAYIFHFLALEWTYWPVM